MAIEITGVSFSNRAASVDKDSLSVAINDPGRQPTNTAQPDQRKVESASAAVNDAQRGQRQELRQQQEEAARESAKELAASVEDLNQYNELRTRNLEFTINEDIDRTIVKVVDAESGELIRQIPAENAVKLARLLKEDEGQVDKALGLLIDSQI